MGPASAGFKITAQKIAVMRRVKEVKSFMFLVLYGTRENLVCNEVIMLICGEVINVLKNFEEFLSNDARTH
jgi:hypothetical protein